MHSFVPEQFIVPVKYITLKDYYRGEGVRSNELNNINDLIKSMIDDSVEYIKSMSDKISLEQLLRIHEIAFSTIWIAHINNVPCFKKAKVQLEKEDKVDEMLQGYLNELRNMFKFYIKIANCDEYDSFKNKISDDEFNKIELDIRNNVEKNMKELMALTEELSYSQIKEIHIDAFEYLLEKDIEAIECFKEAVKGIDMNEFKNDYLKKLEEVFDMQAKNFGCNEKANQEKKMMKEKNTRMSIYDEIDYEFIEKEIEFKIY